MSGIVVKQSSLSLNKEKGDSQTNKSRKWYRKVVFLVLFVLLLRQCTWYSTSETLQPDKPTSVSYDKNKNKDEKAGVTVSNAVLSKALSKVKGTISIRTTNADADEGQDKTPTAPTKTWSITDWKEGSELDPNHPKEFQCKWVKFTAKGSSKQIDMCVHDENEKVSETIEKVGHWPDCNRLPKLWKNSLKTSTSDNAIYVDIGTNIGSCVLEMLLSTNAAIVAFEPNPRNQFALKSTMSKLPKELQDRVVLVPVGLGSESKVESLYFSSRNYGNGVVSKIIKDYYKQDEKSFNKVDIVIERLDSILTTEVTIPLVKMDAQGYECHVLDGLSSNIAKQITHIKYEMARKWLLRQGCLNLPQRIEQLGFEIKDSGGRGIHDAIATRKTSFDTTG